VQDPRTEPSQQLIALKGGLVGQNSL